MFCYEWKLFQRSLVRLHHLSVIYNDVSHCVLYHGTCIERLPYREKMYRRSPT